MTPYYSDDHLALYGGDCRAVLAELPAESVHTVVTSPPYWGLRDYGTATWDGGDPACDHLRRSGGRGQNLDRLGERLGTGGGHKASADDAPIDPFRDECRKCGARRVDAQLGLERTPEEYVANMVAVFREVRRVLREDGTLWLNLGDSYATSNPVGRRDADRPFGRDETQDGSFTMNVRRDTGLKQKDLVGIPWMVARALQAPYYVGKIREERDRAWLAGWMDGEGTISFVERNRGEGHTPTHDARVYITNTDRGPLDHFAGISGGHVYVHDDGTRENRYGSRECYRWQMGTHDGALVLRELYPYLRTKRRQAALVWTLYTSLRHKNGHARTPESVVARRREIADMIRSLNAGGEVTLPSWVEEPPSPTEPGWYLRSDVIWSKPNPMPESVTDRPTKAHEYLFLLSKSARYYYDADAVREAHSRDWASETVGPGYMTSQQGRNDGGKRQGTTQNPAGRNLRSVWTIATEPYPGAHFATFPRKLVEPCVKAGCPEGGTVLDPFAGSGTTLLVAQALGRKAVGIDLNPEYLEQAMHRNRQAPLGLVG